MVFSNRGEEEEDDLFDSVNRMADRMGLQGEKRAVYIDDHMLQGGYQRVQTRESYARVQQEEEDKGGGNRWGFGGRGGSQRNSGRQSGDDRDTF